MTNHPLPAARQVLLDYVTALLKNPEIPDEQVINSMSGAINGLIGPNPQRGVTALADLGGKYSDPIRKPRSRWPSDALYVKDLLPKLKIFLNRPDINIDMQVGLSPEEIKEGMFEAQLISHTITADNVKRVLVANPRHFQRLNKTSNWRPIAKMNPLGESSGRPLLELKKKSKPDTDEHDNQS